MTFSTLFLLIKNPLKVTIFHIHTNLLSYILFWWNCMWNRMGDLLIVNYDRFYWIFDLSMETSNYKLLVGNVVQRRISWFLEYSKNFNWKDLLFLRYGIFRKTPILWHEANKIKYFWFLWLKIQWFFALKDDIFCKLWFSR